MRVVAVSHDHRTLTAHSSINQVPLTLGIPIVMFRQSWRKLDTRSWTLGYMARRFGAWYYGSLWNEVLPVVDELHALRRIRPGAQDVIHFMFVEFGSLSLVREWRKRARFLVGTFHASARRLPSVLLSGQIMRRFDFLTLLARSQLPFFLDHGIPEDRIRVLPHGVDTDFFTPGPVPRAPRPGALSVLLVGSTERDHAFMATVMRRIPPGIAELSVATSDEQWTLNYVGIPNVRRLPWLGDDDLVNAYRGADLLTLPLMDCTANNSLMESMACGTPVMVNRVGGVPEYVDPTCNFVMDGKKVDEWVALLTDFARNPGTLAERRPAVRAWAERFSWSRIAPQYLEFYRQVLSHETHE
jgi:glycosyltransferase involved in cell wall biosynthesis